MNQTELFDVTWITFSSEIEYIADLSGILQLHVRISQFQIIECNRG